MLLILLRDFIPHKKLNAGTLIAKKDFETNVLTYWQAPATFGFKCIIPKGFLLKVKEDSSHFSYYFECFPENVEEFEQKLLPEDIRTDPKFAGYRIFLKFRDLGKNLEIHNKKEEK